MDANQLLHYMRGFFELVDNPTADQIRALRNEVLRAQPVSTEFVPIEVENPIRHVPTMRSQNGGCGCSGFAAPPPAAYLDPSKLP